MRIGILTIDGTLPCPIYCVEVLLSTQHEIIVISEEIKFSYALEPRNPTENYHREVYLDFIQSRIQSDSVLDNYAHVLDLQKNKNFEWLHVLNHNSEDCLELLLKCHLDVIVIQGARKLIEPIYSAARFGAMNFHAGITPYYRGNSTLYWALRNMEKNMVGYTIHVVSEVLDGGNILHQELVPVFAIDSEQTIFKRLCRLQAQTIKHLLNNISQNVSNLPSAERHNIKGSLYKGVPSWSEWHELMNIMCSPPWELMLVDRF